MNNKTNPAQTLKTPGQREGVGNFPRRTLENSPKVLNKAAEATKLDKTPHCPRGLLF
ncbi:MAG: hypothetical protein ACP5VS_07560 [Desulfomonilaceae bacterium]